jgi:DNA-binding NarL/FixJ family response regulator
MTTIYIVDDHPLVVEGVRSILETEPNFSWQGSASSGEQCLSFFKKHTVDVVLMDISLPDINGVDLCKMMKEQHPSVAILALSTLYQGSYIEKMLESGADGYVVKNADKNELVLAIQEVAAGRRYLSFEVQKTLKISQQNKNQLPILTKREKEVLRLIADGLTNAQIAQQLFLSVDTVSSHRKNLLAKTNSSNTAWLIRFAIENGLI